MLEIDPYRSLGEDYNVTTLWERLNKPYLLEKLEKERENQILGV